MFLSSQSQWFVGGLDDGWVDWMMGGVWGIVMEWMGYMATSSIMPLDGLDCDKLNYAIGCDKLGLLKTYIKLCSCKAVLHLRRHLRFVWGRQHVLCLHVLFE